VPICLSRAIRIPNFVLVGDRVRIEPLLDSHPRLKAASRIVHTDVAIKMDDKPSQALRYGRWKSSMWLALEAVKKAEADVAVSAGNTGALMAMSQILSQDHGRNRTPRHRSGLADAARRIVVLDLGASIGADTQHLLDMAMMGARWRESCFTSNAERRPAQYRRRRGQGPRRSQSRRTIPARP
jgi:glycerol-3-phosphate acyltransferase PlsX